MLLIQPAGANIFVDNMLLFVTAPSLPACVAGNQSLNGWLLRDTLTTAAGELCTCGLVDRIQIIHPLFLPLQNCDDYFS